MPLTTITLLESVSAGDRKIIADCIQDALVEAGYPEADRFQRFIRLSSNDFIFDRTYPDLSTPRSDRFTLVEVLFSASQDEKLKSSIAASASGKLEQRLGLNPNDLMVIFTEVGRANAFMTGSTEKRSAKNREGQ